MRERRVEPRTLCSDLVTIEWRDEAGQVQVVSGVLEDISTRGACLQTEAPVPPGRASWLGHNQWVAPCTTAYCSYQEIGYFVGVQFAEGARWSHENFAPKHLTDLSHLGAAESQVSADSVKTSV